MPPAPRPADRSVRSGPLKSTPAKPFTCRSNSPETRSSSAVALQDLAARAQASAAPPTADRGRASCCGCVCRIDAGTAGVTAPSTAALTASGLPLVRHDADDFARLRESGGSTSTAPATAPRRPTRTSLRPPAAAGRPHPASRRGRAGRSRNRPGGSLKARWPFSPMPTNATSIGAAATAPPDALRRRPRIPLAVEQVIAGDAGLR